MSAKIRIAVVGAGRLGRIHARRICELADFELVAVVDPEVQARAATAAETGVAPLTTHRELPGRVDAAVVATPTSAHHAVARELLTHGVHVLVEKPVTATTSQADELVETAERAGRVLQVGHVERFNPAFCALASRIRQPQYIHAERRGGFSFRSTDIGVVLDLMIHDIDLALTLAASSVQRVEAVGISFFGRHEDVAHARIVFDSGCVATLDASRASHASARVMQVWSHDTLASADFVARTATIARASEEVRRGELDVSAMTSEERAHWTSRLLDEHMPAEQVVAGEGGDAISAELEDFAQSIRTGRTPRVSGRHGRQALAVAEEIVASLATSTPQVIPGPHWALAARLASQRRREAG